MYIQVFSHSSFDQLILACNEWVGSSVIPSGTVTHRLWLQLMSLVQDGSAHTWDIFWPCFCTVRGIGDTPSIFIMSVVWTENRIVNTLVEVELALKGKKKKRTVAWPSRCNIFLTIGRCIGWPFWITRLPSTPLFAQTGENSSLSPCGS